jgi:hypothetical protein
MGGLNNPNPIYTASTRRAFIADCLHILGDCRAFWMMHETSGTTFEDVSRYTKTSTLYAVGDLGTPVDISTISSGVAGRMPYILLAAGHCINSPDHADFTRAATNAFSLGGWFYLDDVTNVRLISKFDSTTGAEAREFMFDCDNDGKLRLYIYDETANAAIGRKYNTALSTGQWYLLGARYDGGTDAANIDVLVNGVDVDDSDVADDAGFVTIQNTATILQIGYTEGSGGSPENLFSGKMGPMFFSHTDVSDDAWWQLYQRGLAELVV